VGVPALVPGGVAPPTRRLAAVRSAIALVTETTGGLPDGASLWLLGSAFDVQDPEASALEHFRGSEVAIPEPT
jgi:hypothetical protein